MDYEDYIITFDGVDLTEETFTKDTNYWLDYIKPKLVFFDHLHGYHPLGLQIDEGKIEYNDVPQELFVVGEIKSLEIDDIGIKAVYTVYDKLPKTLTEKLAFWNDVIEQEHSYWLEIVKDKIEEGILGFSSDAHPTLSRRYEGEKSTIIDSWAMPFVSLTHRPAEPRNIKKVRSGDIKQMDMDKEKKPEYSEKDTMVSPELAAIMESLNSLPTQIAMAVAQVLAKTDESETDVEDTDSDTDSFEGDGTIDTTPMAVPNAPVAPVASVPAAPVTPAPVAVGKSVKGAGRYAHVPTVNILRDGRTYDSETKFQKALIAMSRNGTNWQKEVKALGFEVGSTGGFTTRAQHSNEMIDMLRHQSIFLRANGIRPSLVDVVPMNSDMVDYTVLASGTTAYWIGENSPYTESQPSFAQLQLKAKKLGVMVPISNELLADTSIELEAKIREIIVKDIQEAIDSSVLLGTGVGGQPTGVRNTTGVVRTPLNAVPTYTDLRSVITRLESAQVELNDSARWLFNPRDKGTLREMVDPNDNYIWTDTTAVPQIGASMPNSLLLGYQWISSTQVALGVNGTATDGDIYFGNWDSVLFGLRNDITFSTSNVAGTAFANDQTLIKAMVRLDVAMKHPEEIQVLTDVQVS